MMQTQHAIAVLTAPNASIPGAIAMLRGDYRPIGWCSELTSLTIRQVEWVTAPGAGAIPRLSAALAAVGDEPARLVVCENYWSTAPRKLREHELRTDSMVTIKPGIGMPEQPVTHYSVGRLYLLDGLRDTLPKARVALPENRLEDHPDIVCAHELRSALREVQARPRLLDEETQAPGLDRGDVLLLSIALAAHDLQHSAPFQADRESINLQGRRRPDHMTRRQHAIAKKRHAGNLGIRR